MDKNNTDKEEILENVIHSTNSASKALSQLEGSLIKGRFKEGIGAYKTMCNTLVGQRIWTSEKNNLKVNNNFKKIASTAQNIIDILQPYVENLQKLTSIDGEIILESRDSEVKIKSVDAASKPQNNDEDKIIQIVKASPKGQISYTKLRSSLGWNRKELDSILVTMVKNNYSIFLTEIGTRKMVTFNP